MKLISLFIVTGTLCLNMNPAKALSNANSLAKTGKTIRKFVKGVSEFVSGKKPSSNKSKAFKKPGRSPKTPGKSRRHQKKIPKTSRKPKPSSSPQKTESEDSGFKNFVGQMAIAGVSGGGLTLLQEMTKNDAPNEYEYEYEYVTVTPTAEDLNTTPVSTIYF